MVWYTQSWEKNQLPGSDSLHEVHSILPRAILNFLPISIALLVDNTPSFGGKYTRWTNTRKLASGRCRRLLNVMFFFFQFHVFFSSSLFSSSTYTRFSHIFLALFSSCYFSPLVLAPESSTTKSWIPFLSFFLFVSFSVHASFFATATCWSPFSVECSRQADARAKISANFFFLSTYRLL